MLLHKICNNLLFGIQGAVSPELALPHLARIQKVSFSAVSKQLLKFGYKVANGHCSLERGGTHAHQHFFRLHKN